MSSRIEMVEGANINSIIVLFFVVPYY